MITDPAAACDPAFGERATDLVVRLQQRSRTVIDAELKRLARKASSLSQTDLEVVDAALDDIVETLLLARLRAMPQYAARLESLFGESRRAP
jgi:hypothetical protein